MIPHRRRARRPRRAAVALAVAGASCAAFAASPAQAAFTVAPCAGSNVAGQGASFQANAQNLFRELFSSNEGCGATGPQVTYTSSGSGAGRAVMGERGSANPAGNRSTTERFGAADEAPNAQQVAQMNEGPVDTNTGTDITDADDGAVQVVPVATGSVAIAVNYPNGCTIPNGSSTTGATNNETGTNTARLLLTKEQIENVFGGDPSTATWGQLVPGITERAGSGLTAGDCATYRVRRIIRQNDSGTTFAAKDFFRAVNPGRWNNPAFFTNPNTTWPNEVERESGSCPQAQNLEDSSNICVPSSGGNGPVLDLVNATDGSFGYGDLPTARTKGFTVTPNATAANRDTTFWIPVQNTAQDGAASGNTSEPTSASDGNSPDGTKGSNCANAQYANVPASTTGDWSNATASQTTQGYPICPLTYMLVWDDQSEVYPATATEEQRARTVKDYLGVILSQASQFSLAGRDYQRLPQNVLTIATAGFQSVDWNKDGGGGGTTTPPNDDTTTNPNTNTGTGGTGTGTGTTPPPAPPVGGSGGGTTQASNAFTLSSARASRGLLRFTLRLPGAGRVLAAATTRYRGRTLRVGTARVTVPRAGTARFTIRPSSATRRALRRVRSLKVRVAVTYTPTGGVQRTTTRTLTLRGSGR